MKRSTYEADREFLASRFPCFKRKGEPKVPLKVGISGDMERLSVLPHRRLRQFLGEYTRGQSYQEGVAAGGPRYNLAGMPSGKVDEASIHKAVTALGAMRRRIEERDELAELRAAMTKIHDIAVTIRHGIEEHDAISRAVNITIIADRLIYPASARGPSAPTQESEGQLARPAVEGVTPAAGAYCQLYPSCGKPDGHDGECDEIPF